MKDIEDQIKSLNSQADGMETGFAKVGTAFKNIFEGISQQQAGKAKVSQGQYKIASGDAQMSNEGKTEVAIGNKDQLDGIEKYKSGLESLQGSFQMVSSFAGQAQTLLMAMSKDGNDAYASAAKSIGAVMDVANATMQGFQQGGYVGAAVAFTMSVATKIFEAEKAHEEALKKLRDAKIAQQKEYNDLLIQNNELVKKSDTIFGEDSFKKALGYVQQMKEYNDALYSKGSTTRAAGGFAGILGATTTEYTGAINALNNATVQTGSHKSGLFGWGGEKADYSGLLKTYPELIDGQGKLNQELAQSILDNQTLDETSKKALQSALDYSKEYDEALSNLQSYLESIFGSLGSDMMKSITDNLGSTKNALDDFSDYASSSMEKLASDIAYSLYFSNAFSNLQSQLESVMTSTNLSDQSKAEAQLKLMGDFFAGLGDETASADAFLQNFKDQAAAYGFDLWDSNSRTGSSKGIQSISQDSADELNGRFTAIQGHTYNISQGMEILKANSAQTLKHLAGIEVNTARLEAVENGINSIKQGISDINTKGITIKV